jgi:hypothetical protein
MGNSSLGGQNNTFYHHEAKTCWKNPTSLANGPGAYSSCHILMLIITLFTLAFCDGHANDFYTE